MKRLSALFPRPLKPTLLSPLQRFLPASWIAQAARDAGHRWRERLWGPASTLWACIYKQLSAVASAREVEDAAAFWTPTVSSHRDGEAFCQARKRLPRSVFQAAVRHLAGQADRHSSTWHGLSVWLVDGTTVAVPGGQANEAAFGRPGNQHTGRVNLHPPLMRVLLLIGAFSGAVWQVLTGPYCGGSENALFFRLLQELPAGGLLIGDALYGSFLAAALISKRNSHWLAPRHQSRRFRRRHRRLGKNDRLEVWRRPDLRQVRHPEQLQETPPEITVRVLRRVIHRPGFRDHSLTLATTLLDPRRYPADDLVALYAARWHIEGVIRHLKVGLKLDRLTGRSPDVVEKEFLSGVLAYNLLLTLMAQSGAPPATLSLERVRHLVLKAADCLTVAASSYAGVLWQRLWALIATAVLDRRPRDPQPRLVIYTPHPYGRLRIPRWRWRQLHHAA